MSTEILIGGASHPLLFNMNALRNVMLYIGAENFTELNMQKDLAKSMDFALACAFYGILEGYEDKDEKTPFKTIQKLGGAVKRFTELAPALDAFTNAVTDFFSTEEPEGK